MTDDRTLAALDQRGRAAAAGVRAAVAERPVAAFDPDLVRIDVDTRPDPRRRRPVVGLLAAAAAGLVLVAAVVALSAPGDDDSAPADRVAPGDLQRFVLATPPEDHVLSGVFDAAEPRDRADDDLTPFGPLVVYGPDVTTPTFAVYAMADVTEEDVLAAEEIPAREVGGRWAWRPDGDLAALGAGIAVVVGDDIVGVIGASADPDLLLDVAATVEVDGDRAVVPTGTVPEGWEHLGDGHLYDLLPGLAGLQTLDAGPVTWVAAYGSGDEGHVTVSVSGGDAVRARVPVLSAQDVREVEVRGHQAVLTRTPGDVDLPDTVAVTWEERPGEVVQVASTVGLDEEQVLRLAEDLVAVTVADLPDLRREAFEAELTDPTLAVVGRGTFASGIEWALVQYDDEFDQLDLRTTAPPGSSSSESGSSTASGSEAGDGAGPPDPGPFDGYATGTDGALRYAHGRLRPDVVTVEVRDPDGEVVAEADLVEGDGTRAWVAELPPSDTAGSDLYVAVAHDEAGAELGRLEIATA